MKAIFFSMLVLLLVPSAHAQTARTSDAARYEAASWKTWELDNPGAFALPPPPAPAATKAEINAVKAAMHNADANALAGIRYWNAGAPAYRWNGLGKKVMPWDQLDVVLRTPFAWVNIAIYDATVLAWKEKLKYKRPRPHQADPSIKPLIAPPLTYSYPCEHSVTAAAAAYVLAYFIPAKGDSIIALARAAAQSRIDAGVQFPSDVTAGWKLGEEVARAIIAKAKADGSAMVYKGAVNKDPAKWTGSFQLGISLPLYRTIALKSADQFRPPPPPDFEAEMKEMKNFRQTFKSRSLAYYWAGTGPEMWNDLVGQKMFETRMSDDAPAVARIYAVLNTAYHDIAIAVFDAKYAYWGIRPAQYDTTFKPLIGTPPFPGYPSGHAAGAGATSAVLEYFFPADAQQFQQLAQDCADSRFYAGIHFKSDNEVALRMGKEVGRYITQRWMESAPGPTASAGR